MSKIKDCSCGNKHLTNTGQYGYGEKDVNFRQIVADTMSSGIWLECGKCGKRTIECKTEDEAIGYWNNNHHLVMVYTTDSYNKLKQANAELKKQYSAMYDEATIRAKEAVELRKEIEEYQNDIKTISDSNRGLHYEIKRLKEAGE